MLRRSSCRRISLPFFGRQRKHHAKNASHVQMNLGEVETEEQAATAEEGAKRCIQDSYMFVEKPVWMSWREFLAELRRFEFNYELLTPEGLVKWELLDHEQETKQQVSCLFDMSDRVPFVAFNQIFVNLNSEQQTLPNFAAQCCPQPTSGSGESLLMLHEINRHESLANDPLQQEPASRMEIKTRVGQTSAKWPVQGEAPSTAVQSAIAELIEKPPKVFQMSAQCFCYHTLSATVAFMSGTYLGVAKGYSIFDLEANRTIENQWHATREFARLEQSAWPIAKNMLEDFSRRGAFTK